MPYADLLAAATKAVALVRKDAGAAAAEASIWGFMPTKDGDLLPEHAFTNGSEKLTADVPMIIGSVMNEFAGFAVVTDPSLLHKSESEAVATLQTKYGDKTADYVKAYKKAYSDKPAYLMPLVDFKYRPQAVSQVRIKAADQGASVWNYVFTYQSTALDGILTASHCAELPYVFNNVTRCAASTDATPAAIRLGDVMSSAWINFARTGNPNGRGVPHWDAYTIEAPATMIFDTDSRCRKGDFDADLLKIGKE